MWEQHWSCLACVFGRQKRFRDLAIFAAVVLVLLGGLVILEPDHPASAALYPGARTAAVDRIEDEVITGWPIPTESQYAFMTLLSADKESHSNGSDVNEDHYFNGARILAYQFCHAVNTRSKVPFVVLVTPEVDHRKREQLERDGALVHEVETVTSGLLHPTLTRWEDTLTKFRLWELTQFKRIAFFDADMIIFRNLDHIFDDPGAQLQRTTKDGKRLVDAGVLPKSYVFGGYAEQTLNHSYPPTELGVEHDIAFPWYFNTGLFIVKPDPVLFKYYISLTHAPEGKPQEPSSLPFDSSLPDQNLLNFAHRWSSAKSDWGPGSMPWQAIDPKWVTHHTTVNDIEKGAYAAHVHYWDPVHRDIQPYLLAKKAEMEAFYESREALEEEGWRPEDFVEEAAKQAFQND